MIPEQPTDWTCGPKAMLRQVAMRKLIDAGTPEFDMAKVAARLDNIKRKDIDLWRAHNISADHPAIWRGRRCYREPLAGLALRLFAVSNGFHECRSETVD